MSVTAHNFIGQNNSSTPAEVISNLFPDAMQRNTEVLPSTNQYNSSMGQNLIKIQANLSSWQFANSGINPDIYQRLSYPVYGIMTSDFTYSVQSEWEQMQFPQILDITDIANMAAWAGGGELGAVARTQKFWKRSGDIKLSPTFRILDVDGNGAVLQYIHTLLLMSTAVGTQEIANGLGGFVSAAQAVTGSVLGGLADGAGAVGGAVDAVDPSGIANMFISAGATALNLAAGAISNVLLENINDYNTLRASPPPVDIQIGKIFRHKDMVITDISFQFSKEYTAKGPMYADVTLQVASRKIISDITNVGLSTTLMAVDGNPNPYESQNVKFTYDFNGASGNAGANAMGSGQVNPSDVTTQSMAKDVDSLRKLNYSPAGGSPNTGSSWSMFPNNTGGI